MLGREQECGETVGGEDGDSVVMAFGLARMLSLLLFEVGAPDPTVFVTIVVVLTVTGMVASFLPARRAARVDPTVAMRAE